MVPRHFFQSSRASRLAELGICCLVEMAKMGRIQILRSDMMKMLLEQIDDRGRKGT
jgi:hypothetical protein